MDELEKHLDEAFAVLREFVDVLNKTVKTMNRLRQLCDVIKADLTSKGGDK